MSHRFRPISATTESRAISEAGQLVLPEDYELLPQALHLSAQQFYCLFQSFELFFYLRKLSRVQPVIAKCTQQVINVVKSCLNDSQPLHTLWRWHIHKGNFSGGSNEESRCLIGSSGRKPSSLVFRLVSFHVRPYLFGCKRDNGNPSFQPISGASGAVTPSLMRLPPSQPACHKECENRTNCLHPGWPIDSCIRSCHV